MRVVSSKGTSTCESFFDAVCRGVPEDGGVFIPVDFQPIPSALFNNIHRMSQPDICYVVANSLIGEEVPPQVLKRIVDEIYKFDLPVKRIFDNGYALDFSFVPGDSYRSIGAHFITEVIKHIRESNNDTRHFTVLSVMTSATSLIMGRMFSRLADIDLVAIFPRQSLSKSMNAQMKAFGSHIYPVEMSGTSEECIALVGELMDDAEMKKKFMISSFTATNPGMVLARVFQFFQAYAQLVLARKAEGHSGAGLLGGGLVYFIPEKYTSSILAADIARKLGLPAKRFETYFDMDECRSMISGDEIAVVIPPMQLRQPEETGDSRHQPAPERISLTVPALKRFIINNTDNPLDRKSVV